MCGVRLACSAIAVGADTSNIYYFAVRPFASGAGLIAFFPAALSSGGGGGESEGGIYSSSSTDGYIWRAPRRLLASPVLSEFRTSDYPIDGFAALHPLAARAGAAAMPPLADGAGRAGWTYATLCSNARRIASAAAAHLVIETPPPPLICSLCLCRCSSD